jgi:hypothetical protein
VTQLVDDTEQSLSDRENLAALFQRLREEKDATTASREARVLYLHGMLTDFLFGNEVPKEIGGSA